jgi:hypothetical protein
MRTKLVSWQWEAYPTAHRDRRNLALHLVTAPLFLAGLGAVLAGIVAGWWVSLAGLGTMLLVLAVQGRGHGLETNPPIPFTGPGDLITRFLAEQLINFPRFVLSGGWARAWRAAPPSSQRAA